MPGYIVHWYQPNSEEVDYWEFQCSRIGDNSDWMFAEPNPVVSACPDCYEVSVHQCDGSSYVRSRAVNANGESQWSDAIAFPEPSFALTLLISLIAIFILSDERKRLCPQIKNEQWNIISVLFLIYVASLMFIQLLSLE